MKDDIKDLIKDKVQTDDNFRDAWELYEHLDYSGLIHELIDSNIDVYNSDLRIWAVNNYHYVDEAIEQGLTDACGDYHRLIQCGQYVQLSEEAHELVEELFNEMKGTYFNLVEEVAS